MEGKFKFYNVGQGTFYGGAIEHNEQKFVVVYDCGSVSSGQFLQLSINDFKANYNRIDLLVVSHLHEDHFNGIIDLINGISVDRVVLPYFPIINRLSLAAGFKGDNQDYISFLNNPVSFFLSKGLDAITFIDQFKDKEGGPELPPDREQTEIPDQISEGQISIELPEEQEEFKGRALEDDARMSVDGIEVNYLAAGSLLRLNNRLWEFVFYHKINSNQINIEDFQRAVNQYLIDKGIADLTVLFNDDYRTDIQTLYIDHINRRDLNYSSVCMYHGPLFRSQIRALNCETVEGLGCTYMLNGMQTGTILTGDQYLKTRNDFNPFINFYRSRLSNLGVLQVPHHGSKKNWKLLPNELNITKCYVVNHGYQKTGHPHPEVFENIRLHKGDAAYVSNHQYSPFDYQITAL
jgi:ribonuclease BN (tRNA processing enzyme)